MKSSGQFLKAAFAATLLSSPLAIAAALPVESRISAATVYLDRAVVTRNAHTLLPAGESEVVFERLPAGLLDASLQVSARGSTAVTLIDVAARQTYVEATLDPRVRSIEEELKAIQRQDADLKGRLALFDQQRALISRIEAAATTPPPRDAVGSGARPGFEEWQKLLTFQFENLSRIASDQDAVVRQREDLTAKAAALQSQLNLLRSRQTAARSYKTVSVRVSSEVAGSLDVSISYAVPGASWSPSYDARLNTETRSVELGYFGSVRNGTGEDWSAIALTLSTARPSQGGGAPTLPPWIVDVYRAMPYPAQSLARSSAKVALELSAGAVAQATALADKAEDESIQAYFAQAAIESGMTRATFRIGTPITLPSDNAAQRVPITRTGLTASLHYEATPKLIEAAFLSASVSNATDFPLLAGPVNTFLDDSFVATSHLKSIMPREKFDLAFGADDGISVKRRLVNRFAEETGFTSKGRRVTYEFLVTLTNNKKTAERVVFKEAVPLSRDEKIVVKLLSPAERDIGAAEGQKEITRDAEGRLVWKVDLKPGEKREFPIKVSIDYPSDITVSGLD
ncbi:MAG: mucoidy inhibitor MuiA family protein [Opitutaceae bacterium]|nr:mucoidy inhibitor MuiA family protein [Opitutaceae bacterium]